MSDFDQAIAIAQAQVAFWAEVEREWLIPKNDLTAHFVRKDAKARREIAEKIAAEIGALAARASTPNDEAGFVPASPISTPNDE